MDGKPEEGAERLRFWLDTEIILMIFRFPDRKSKEKAKRSQKGVLIIVENLPLPFDRRVWMEATTLRQNGYEVSIICPKGKGYEQSYEEIDGINIYRHCLPLEGSGALGYVAEYLVALFWQFTLACKILFKHGFDVIHACNPPDNIFIIGIFFKLFGVKFLFDHHDISPELYEAKFGKRGFFYKIILLWERWSFMLADISIATNESYREIAIRRGKMNPKDVFVVRSGPDLKRLRIMPPIEQLKRGRKYLVGYVGVMGKQEGMDLLLEAVRYIVYEKNRRDISFSLIGSGTESEAMKEYASNLQVEEYVSFTGRIPDQEMLEILNTADICVNPDMANEMNDKSTMNKIMEYMALGKPIVQFDLTEGRFSAQESSLYAKKNDIADFAEKIMLLIDNPEKRSAMGRFGRKRVTEVLEWKYEAPKLLSAYDAIWQK